MTNEAKLKTTVSANKAAPKKRKIASLDRRKARAGWFFVLPFVIGFVLVYLPMVYDSIVMSFNTVNIVQGGGYELEFVGWKNYHDALFDDPNFFRTLTSGLTQLAFDIPAILIFSLFMAVLLNQKMVGRAAFRAIFFLPVVLATGIMEGIEAQNTLSDYMGSTEGIETGEESSAASEIVSAMDIQRLFSGMKVGQGIVTYVANAVNNIFNIVNRSGVQMLIFLAALQSISPAIYESCRIDGATSWETFWKITLPMISPMILVNGVYTIIDSFTTDSNQVMKYVAEVYGDADGQTLSSAMAWIYFLIIIVIVAIIGGIFSAYVFYQKKDM
ncbi:MAG: sugar ABC transporter permease [Clostridia bacterium]|nr:sugar ABC transporter permease [Clostridia bacterium]